MQHDNYTSNSKRSTVSAAKQNKEGQEWHIYNTAQWEPKLTIHAH